LIPGLSSPQQVAVEAMLSGPMTTIDEEMQYNTLHSNTPNSVRITMSEQFK